MKIERGDILMVNLGQVPGTSLQSVIRPVVVVSNNKANTYSPVVTVVPFTSRVYKKRYLPTHVSIIKTMRCVRAEVRLIASAVG